MRAQAPRSSAQRRQHGVGQQLHRLPRFVDGHATDEWVHQVLAGGFGWDRQRAFAQDRLVDGSQDVGEFELFGFIEI